ncbi:MAG: RNA polymerase sigma factor [Bacteroidales bacterium]|nr:RNA polymerase sigma factor [Bacteroidales bacterium]
MSLNFFRHKNFTEEELLIAISNGDNDAFNELYLRYKDRLLYYFCRMLSQDKEIAKDFTQEIFIKIINKPHLFNPKMSFSTWVFSVANNMCKNEYRRLEVRKNTIQCDNPDSFNNEELNNENHEPTVKLIFTQLEQFDESHKSAFLLKYREGFSIEEISEILELPVGTVKSRLFYTRKKLQENIKNNHPEIVEQFNL